MHRTWAALVAAATLALTGCAAESDDAPEDDAQATDVDADAGAEETSVSTTDDPRQGWADAQMDRWRTDGNPALGGAGRIKEWESASSGELLIHVTPDPGKDPQEISHIASDVLSVSIQVQKVTVETTNGQHVESVTRDEMLEERRADSPER